ncbi:MAG: DUF2232 domain-containing protein [Magnetococcales bacterium]|nr:DUF2232 domain-containing protein [Magnetococcales bacterium]
MFLRALVANPVLAGVTATALLIIPLGAVLLAPLQLVAPLPLLLVALRQGMKAGFQALAFPVAGALFLSGEMHFPAMVILLFGAFPLLAAWMLRNGWRMSQCGSVAFFISLLLLAGGLLLAFLSGFDPSESARTAMEAARGQFLKDGAEQGMDAVALMELRTGLDQIVEILARLFPALFTTGWFLVQVGNLALARSLLGRWGEDWLTPELPQGIRLPFFLIWPFIGSGLLALTASGSLGNLGVNLVFFLVIPYFFQGLAVVLTAFRLYGVSGFVRGVFYAALILWGELFLLVMIVGLFDTWMDFRKRLPKPEEDDGISKE